MRKLLSSNNSLLIILWGFINIFVVACESRKYTECQQMITLANKVTKQTQAIAEKSSDQDLDNWLEASDIMEQAAENIAALELKDSQLIEYQESLTNIYRVYAQATHEAVKARENRNLSALQSAHEEANNISEVNDNLVKNINNYCLKP